MVLPEWSECLLLWFFHYWSEACRADRSLVRSSRKTSGIFRHAICI